MPMFEYLKPRNIRRLEMCSSEMRITYRKKAEHLDNSIELFVKIQKLFV